MRWRVSRKTLFGWVEVAQFAARVDAAAYIYARGPRVEFKLEAI